jgi:type IV pilus assembly protein PilV
MKGFSTATRQRGIGLVEVLVAAFIIAIGLLGVAGLQTRSLQMNQSAHFRSQATYYAYEIVESMRVNRDAARGGDYDIDFGEEPPGGNSVTNQALQQWIDGIETTLPMREDGTTGGSISVDGNIATVQVAWFDQRWSEDANDQVRSVLVETEL